MKENFKDKISHNCLMTKVPEYNESYAAGAYYMPGDILGKRKGKFYMNLGKFKDLSKIEVESLTLHETIPDITINLLSCCAIIPILLKHLRGMK